METVKAETGLLRILSEGEAGVDRPDSSDRLKVREL